MDLMLVAARLILAGVFIVAGAAKLADRRGSVQAMRDFGVPERLAGPLGMALPLAEIAVAIALIPTATVRWGALGALILLFGFVAGIGYNLARGNQPDCHCFGQLHSEPAGWQTLARNSVLLTIATFLIIAGWGDPGPSTVAWLGDLSTFERFTLTSGLIGLVLIGLEGWVLLHLLQQNGRLLIRLDTLESVIERGAPATPPVSRGSNTPISGLRAGSIAPAFELPNLAGTPTTLRDLVSPTTPTLLVFSDPGCGPCNSVMADIATWQQEHAGKLAIAVVSRGDLEANRSRAGEHGIRNVVLQKNREVAESFQVTGTPSGVLVRPDLTIGSAVAAGADAIRGLVATSTTAPSRHVPMANGTTGRRTAPDMTGKPAPDARLRSLDGVEVSLSAYFGRPTVLLFWNPGCGFCQRMLDDVKAHEAGQTTGTPNIVVISTGDVERNLAQGMRSTVLLDQGFSVGRQYGASGTPSAVLVDEDGRITSRVAVGAPAVLALMASGRAEGTIAQS